MSNTMTVLRSAEPAAPSDLIRKFYRPADVVRVTGASKSVVCAGLQSGQLEGYKRGSSWFIPVPAVDTWICGANRDCISKATAATNGEGFRRISMHPKMYHSITHPDQPVDRLERLLQTLLERHGCEHPLTKRIAEQLDRARVARRQVAP